MENDQVLSIADAAQECGMTVSEFIDQMTRDGLLIEHPNGGCIASPHPDIRELDR
jgi:hypothetical protein